MCYEKRRDNKKIPYTDRIYDTVNLYEGPKIKFSTCERNITLKKTKLPGPGSYETVQYIGKLPKYALKPVE